MWSFCLSHKLSASQLEAFGKVSRLGVFLLPRVFFPTSSFIVSQPAELQRLSLFAYLQPDAYFTASSWCDVGWTCDGEHQLSQRLG